MFAGLFSVQKKFKPECNQQNVEARAMFHHKRAVQLAKEGPNSHEEAKVMCSVFLPRIRP